MQDMTVVLDRRLQDIKASRVMNAAGRVRRYDGQIVHATSFPASVGTECRVACENGEWAEAEYERARLQKALKATSTVITADQVWTILSKLGQLLERVTAQLLRLLQHLRDLCRGSVHG